MNPKIVFSIVFSLIVVALIFANLDQAPISAFEDMEDSVIVGVDDVVAPLSQTENSDIFIQSGDLLVGAVTVELTYDHTKIMIEECSYATSDFQGVCNISQEGSIYVTGINITGVSGKSILASLKIRPLEVGNSLIEIPSIETLTDNFGEPISGETRSGTIIVFEEGTTPQPTMTHTPVVVPSPTEITTSTPAPPSVEADEFVFLPFLIK